MRILISNEDILGVSCAHSIAPLPGLSIPALLDSIGHRFKPIECRTLHQCMSADICPV